MEQFVKSTVSGLEVSPKGGVKPAVSKALKAAVADQFEAMGFVRTPKGAFVVELGTDANGKTVYAKVELTVTNADVFAEPKPKEKTSKAAEEVVLPDLF